MLLGYELAPDDNDEFFINNEARISKEYLYKNTYEYNHLPASLIIKRRETDIGSTHDGFTIVSDRLKLLCNQFNFGNLEFISLPADRNFYVLRVHNVMKFDYVARGTTFEKYNKEFDKYEWIHGSSPVCLQDKIPIPEGTIYRSDIFFGAGVRKSPVEMVGIKTKELMESWKLKGIYFNEILDEYPVQKRRTKGEEFY